MGDAPGPAAAAAFAADDDAADATTDADVSCGEKSFSCSSPVLLKTIPSPFLSIPLLATSPLLYSQQLLQDVLQPF